MVKFCPWGHRNNPLPQRAVIYSLVEIVEKEKNPDASSFLVIK